MKVKSKRTQGAEFLFFTHFSTRLGTTGSWSIHHQWITRKYRKQFLPRVNLGSTFPFPESTFALCPALFLWEKLRLVWLQYPSISLQHLPSGSFMEAERIHIPHKVRRNCHKRLGRHQQLQQETKYSHRMKSDGLAQFNAAKWSV